MSEPLDENEKLYAQAVALVKSMEHPSVCSLQRKFRIGYGRAMNIIDMMVQRGDWPMEKETRRKNGNTRNAAV
jgi:DNA segregation ATPase FtsK/SpoIIIE-like protein